MVFQPSDAIYRQMHNHEIKPVNKGYSVPSKLAACIGLSQEKFVCLVHNLTEDGTAQRIYVNKCDCTKKNISNDYWEVSEEDKSIFRDLKDLCFVHENGDNLLLIVNTWVKAYDMKKRSCVWTISGQLPRMQHPLNATHICTDGAGHIFVVDSDNGCVHMFTTEGRFISSIVKKGDYGIENPQFVSWSSEEKILVLLHEVMCDRDMKIIACGLELSQIYTRSQGHSLATSSPTAIPAITSESNSSKKWSLW